VAGDGGAAVRAEVAFPASGHVYEMRSGEYLGRGDSAEFDLEPTSAPIFAVLPYEVKALKLKASDGRVTAALETDGRTGEHVFRFEVLDADGRRMLDRGANVVAAGGECEWAPEGGFSGAAKVSCRDVVTGASALVEL
jgi:hypothetical protein